MTVQASFPCDFDATTVLAFLRARTLSAEEVLVSCLDRIAEREPDVHAFVAMDVEQALGQARAIDAGRRYGGALEGIPFGIKDVIDVAGMNTHYGSDLPIGVLAQRDAAVVDLLRRAGGLPLGKTETVEFAASGRIPPTRNPHDATRTAGGSSSGSAAAVAAGMVFFAVGTQTGGSLVRPASYNGVYALKPSYGSISVDGVHPHAPSLDCVGWHTRSVVDLDLLASACGFPPPRREVPRSDLRIAICRTPHWDALDGNAQAAFDGLLDQLKTVGVEPQTLCLPREFNELSSAQFAIMRGEARVSFLRWHQRFGDLMHTDLAALFSDEAADAQMALAKAQRIAAACRLAYAEASRPFDTVIVPAATGEAPPWEAGTGSPIMNRMWSALHVPIVAMPIRPRYGRLPIGCQLVGHLYEDRRLIQTAASLNRMLEG